jgi:putative membrane protein insertion efficiency factor
MRKLLIFIIKLYQIIFINKRPCCRFIPTCSVYAIEAIKKYGALKGSILAIKRILKCRPKMDFGYDPVD